MTAILVSVRTLAEARIALRCGVDVIDLKEPSAGSLGSVSLDVATQISAAIGNSTRKSIAMGELLDWKANTYDHWPIELFDFAKIGLAGLRNSSDWRRKWLVWKDSLPTSVAAVAVSYADAHVAAAPSVDTVIDDALQSGFHFVLLDTFDKSAGRLTDYLSARQLAEICRRLTESAATLAVAGRLTRESLPELRAMGVPIVAFRGAACEAGRDSALSEIKLRDLVNDVKGKGSRNDVRSRGHDVSVISKP